MEQDTRFELALTVWKTVVLTANTNPAYMIPLMHEWYQTLRSVEISLIFNVQELPNSHKQYNFLLNKNQEFLPQIGF